MTVSPDCTRLGVPDLSFPIGLGGFWMVACKSVAQFAASIIIKLQFAFFCARFFTRLRGARSVAIQESSVCLETVLDEEVMERTTHTLLTQQASRARQATGVTVSGAR